MGGGFSRSNESKMVDPDCNLAETVQKYIDENAVMIFSKSYCPYCRMAKSSLTSIGATFKVIELDKHKDGDAMLDILYSMTGARTVPRVFVKGTCIGGGTETKAMVKSGEMERRLKD